VSRRRRGEGESCFGGLTVRSRALLVLALWLSHAGPAAAQFQVLDPGTVNHPALGGVGVTAGLGGPFAATLIAEGGPPGSQAFTDDPLAPELFGPNFHIGLGFEYLRPHYTNRATTLVVPPGAAAAFPIRGALGDVTNNFAFVPRFGIEYIFPDTAGFGIGASGKLFTLQGDLRRTVTGSAGSGVLNAENTLSIGSANVLEGLIRFPLNRMECFQDCSLEHVTLLGSIGGRYGYVRQDFTSSLTSGANLASLTATQDFTGFGITGSLGTLCPLGEKQRFALYGLARGSLLVGQNNRTSTFSTVIAGDGSTAGQLTERRSQLIPVGEFELGASWGLPLGKRTALGAAPMPPVVWLRAGWITQIWGGLGLLSPPPNSTLQGATFSGAPLLLYGFTIQVGFTR
jgi:Legionella pneumophila major outer membrane protein precursor